MEEYGPDISKLDTGEVCRRIHKLTSGMMEFWKNSRGWAPMETAGLLSRSMLDWQTSLAECLTLWLEASTDGELILAWANLGSLVEGQLKLFLSVWYDEYKIDANSMRRNRQICEPDVLELDPLRQFFAKSVWRKGERWDAWILHIQQKRNAIHAFRNRDLATFDDWKADLRNYLAFLRYMNSRLPYPDGIYVPQEA
jgi:hypothetical protein